MTTSFSSQIYNQAVLSSDHTSLFHLHQLEDLGAGVLGRSLTHSPGWQLRLLARKLHVALPCGLVILQLDRWDPRVGVPFMPYLWKSPGVSCLRLLQRTPPDSREGDTAPLLSRGSTLYEEPGTSRTSWCSHLWKMSPAVLL